MLLLFRGIQGFKEQTGRLNQMVFWRQSRRMKRDDVTQRRRMETCTSEDARRWKDVTKTWLCLCAIHFLVCHKRQTPLMFNIWSTCWSRSVFVMRMVEFLVHLITTHSARRDFKDLNCGNVFSSFASFYLEGGVLLLEQTVLHYDELSSSFWRHCFCFPSWQPCHKPRSSWGTVLPHWCLICCHRHLSEVVVPLTLPAVIQQSVLHNIKKSLGSGRLHFAFFHPYVGCAGRLSLLLQLHSAFFFFFSREELLANKNKTKHSS